MSDVTTTAPAADTPVEAKPKRTRKAPAKPKAAGSAPAKPRRARKPAGEKVEAAPAAKPERDQDQPEKVEGAPVKKQPAAPAPKPTRKADAEAGQLKAALKAANMSEGSELTDAQKHRALTHPPKMAGDRLREFILHGNSNAGAGALAQFAEHKDLARAATELLRTTTPTRQCSARGAATTVELIGRKDWHKLLGGITDEQTLAFARGEVFLRDLPSEVQAGIRDLTREVCEKAPLKRFDTRELIAIVAAAKLGGEK